MSYSKLVDIECTPAFSFYGLVTSFRAPSPTQGTDYIMTMRVTDPSLYNNNESDGLSIVIFRASATEMPAVKKIGDCVQFKRFKVQMFQGAYQAISTHWSGQRTFYRSGTDGEGGGGVWRCREDAKYVVGAEECDHLNSFIPIQDDIAQAIDGVGGDDNKWPFAGKRPTVKISELVPSLYFNVYGKVIATPNKPSNGNQINGALDHYTFIITDYTRNPLLTHPSPQSLDLPAFLEGRLLTVTVWDDWVGDATKLAPNQHIRIDNLHCKYHIDEDGGGGGGGEKKVLQAVLHGDASSKRKIFTLDPNAPESVEIEERGKQVLEIGNSNGTAMDSCAVDDPSSPPRYKLATALDNDALHTQNSFHNNSDKLSDLLPTIIINNASMRAYQHTPIATIATSTQYPLKFAVHARLVDYHPANVKDFSRPFCTTCDCIVSVAAEKRLFKCAQCSGNSIEWQWIFTITLSDSSSPAINSSHISNNIKVIVAGAEACKLLNGMQPSSLCTNKYNAIEYLHRCMERLKECGLPGWWAIKSFSVDGGASIRWALFDTIVHHQF